MYKINFIFKDQRVLLTFDHFKTIRKNLIKKNLFKRKLIEHSLTVFLARVIAIFLLLKTNNKPTITPPITIDYITSYYMLFRFLVACGGVG